MKTATYLRHDTETPWGTYAAGTPVDIVSTGIDSIVVRLADLPRYPLDLRLRASKVAVKAPPLLDQCVDCGGPTMRGWRRGRCVECALPLGQRRSEVAS